MDKSLNYIAINREAWNTKTDIHLKSEFYNLNDFIQGKSSLNSIELDLLGDINGKSVLHLQCHFGQDSISLSRLGAVVTGVDLADNAIKEAKKLAAITQTDVDFICCDVYDLPKYLNKQFDVVFTSYGTIGWLPDLEKWATIVSQFLKPGGQLVFAEFHPVVWMFDNDFEKIAYSYFNAGPIIENENGTYADKTAPIATETVSWNHGLSEVVNSLIKHGLEINALHEFDYSPYNCFNHTVEQEPGKYRITRIPEKIPMVYSILATKK